MSPGRPTTELRAGNLGLILDTLRLDGPLPRTEIVRRVGLSRATVSSLLSELFERRLVRDAANVRSTAAGGRPPAHVALEPSTAAAVGVDIGRTHVRAVVADLSFQVLAEAHERIEVLEHPQETLDLVVATTERLLTESGVDRADLLGMGVGLPGPVDRASGRLGSSTILPAWVGLAPGAELESRLGTPVVVENDANVGALAEALLGAGRGSRVLAYIKVAGGVGAGLVVAGQLFRGASGTAGEIGHTTMANSGPVCRCGNRGCLELLAGASALLRQMAAAGVELDGVPSLLRMAAEGHAGVRRVLADAGELVGLAVANLVTLLDADRVVVGGELAAAGEVLVGPLRYAARSAAVTTAGSGIEIVVSDLGERAEVLGSVALVLREPRSLGPALLARR
ncbi:MAG: ROK family transcriptional regulator [Actinomycetota bacterium]|nr:ROK family transcriptional regulator [Actinomycetota bacterium]